VGKEFSLSIRMYAFYYLHMHMYMRHTKANSNH
jgi:hypothetical protein